MQSNSLHSRLYHVYVINYIIPSVTLLQNYERWSHCDPRLDFLAKKWLFWREMILSCKVIQLFISNRSFAGSCYFFLVIPKMISVAHLQAVFQIRDSSLIPLDSSIPFCFPLKTLNRVKIPSKRFYNNMLLQCIWIVFLAWYHSDTSRRVVWSFFDVVLAVNWPWWCRIIEFAKKNRKESQMAKENQWRIDQNLLEIAWKMNSF